MTNPKSFRLNKDAQENLTRLSKQFDLSESKIINLLLTETSHKSGLTFGNSEAELILREYFRVKALVKC